MMHFLHCGGSCRRKIRPVITFAYYTGCRKGEILALQWSQVDLAERVVRLEPGETKNDDARTIPLVADLYEMLKLQKETRDNYYPKSPWYFFAPASRFLSSRTHGRPPAKRRASWMRAARRRSSFMTSGARECGTWCERANPERVAMMISGHKTRSVFDRYNIVSESDLKDAARLLGEYMAHKGTPEPAAKDAAHTTGTQEPPAAIN